MYLIPEPKKVTEGKGTFLLTYETYLSVDPVCSFRISEQAMLFEKEIRKSLGYGLEVTRGKGKGGDIVLCLDERMGEQGYCLTIHESGVSLTGGEKGLWHGLQTLRQIIEQKGAVLPAMEIEDAPELPNRGFYFDCTRGRIPKLEWLKQLADRMAYYKLNQLQLYVEHTYLFRGMTELWRDDTPLTAAEILELDRYCLARGIELVPSLSSFGHLYKLLSTKEYAHLCELEDTAEKPFSLTGRMHHHTINTADPESLALIKRLIGEYMELFSSRQFNLCADETFDLGRGRSRERVEALGRDRVYIDFVKEVAQFLLDNGRRPMFWGDIILDFPEMIRELPKEIICLNWGYSPDLPEEDTQKMQQAGAVQYCCPGCSSWNQFIPKNYSAYHNIIRQCTYAQKYGAIGVLNTDWGDYLHLSHPDFSRVGMIYGAAFSWSSRILPFEEINRQISRLEYGDRSERLLSVVAKLEKNTAFTWEEACRFWERERELEPITEYREETGERFQDQLPLMEDVDEKNGQIAGIIEQLYGQLPNLEAGRRPLATPYLVGAEGILVFNLIGKVVTARAFGKRYEIMPDPWLLAKRLETWFYHYKKVYRSVSRESELRRIEALVCWYGDYLRA